MEEKFTPQGSNEPRGFQPKPRIPRRPLGGTGSVNPTDHTLDVVTPIKKTNQNDRYTRTAYVGRSAKPATRFNSPQNPSNPNRRPGGYSAPARPAQHTQVAPVTQPNTGAARPVNHPPHAAHPSTRRPGQPPLARKTFGGANNHRRGSENKYGAIAAITEDTKNVKPVIIGSGSRTLKVIPLGGAGEVGSKNMTVFEYGQDIVIVDCGIGFPTEDQPGIDSVVPDVTYLEERRANIRGMVITHGHEDHIGGVPFIWPRLRMPIYTAPLTAGLIKAKLEEANLNEVDIRICNPGDKLQFGQINVELVRLTHSIPDAMGLAIRCPAGLFFYAVDWRLEHAPVLGKPADWARIAQLSQEGVTALFSDSTNAERPGYSPSERIIEETYNNIFQRAKGRIILAQFASNLNRVQQVFNVAKRYGRRIALSGRSMERYVNIAMQLGYLSIPDGILIDLRKVGTIPAEKVVILSTGSQGEEFSALTRMSEGEHRQITIDKTDTVIVSASVIPGNERPVYKVIDNLSRLGANVVQSKEMDVHVSGHPSQEELKLMISLCRPKYFVPIHGDYRHLVAHAKLATELGIPTSNIFLVENGQMLEFDDKGGRIANEKVQTGEVMIDGLGVGDVGPVVLKDRITLGQEGMITILMVADKKTGQLIASPDIVSRGFIYLRENEDLVRKMRDVVKRSYEAAYQKFPNQPEELKSQIKDDVTNFVYTSLQRNPIVIPVIATV